MTGMSPQGQIAESRIQEALEEGVFDGLPGKGERLDLEGYHATPEDWRMAMSVLRSAEIVPEEVELLREIHRLQEQLAQSRDEVEQGRLRRKRAEMMAVYELKMQRYSKGTGMT